jgi:hypothetical protein
MDRMPHDSLEPPTTETVNGRPDFAFSRKASILAPVPSCCNDLRYSHSLEATLAFAILQFWLHCAVG